MPEPRSRTPLLARNAGGPRLADIAPTLAVARDEFLRERRSQRAHIAVLERLILKAQSCVAHRELQLIRALNTGDGRYIARRQKKLANAQRDLDRHRRQRAELGDDALVLVPAERTATPTSWRAAA